jgi:hypothetical protein
MSASKIIGAGLGLILLVAGFLGVALSLVAILDPAVAQMADDANPFGPPRSFLSSASLFVFYLIICAVGVFLTWRSLRKRPVSV